jgi:hypothetical protein
MSQVFTMLHSLIFNFHFILGAGLERMVFKMAFCLWILLIVQLLQFRSNDPMVVLKRPKLVRFAFYYGALLLMMVFGALGQNQFIYFQF